jgi:di/tricarboxylate transporter
MITVEFIHQAIALSVTVGVFLALQLRRGVAVDWLFLCGMLIVTATGVIPVADAIGSFASTAILTIGGLLAVSAGLRSTGVLDWVGEKLLGGAATEQNALWRLAGSMIVSSALLLNTALVAMMMPVVIDWCRRRGISPSRLLLPLSYLVILGGVCTLVGTSTTLVVNDTLKSQQLQVTEEIAAAAPGGTLETATPQQRAFVDDIRPMGLTDITWVGVPCAIVGALYLVLIGRNLLPQRSDMLEQLGDQRREYLLEMLVQSECPLIGKTVQTAGLRNLPGLFLIEIDRHGDIITPAQPDDVIHDGDRLIFTGVVTTIVDLEKIPGLVPAADTTYEFHPQARSQRYLTEVVLSRTSPLIGRTVREANFRQQYAAAVVAVHRNGVRLTNKIGNIRLEPGDTLLLQTRSEFVSIYRNSRDFYLVSSVDGHQPRRHDRAWWAAGILIVLMVWLVAANWIVAAFPTLAGLGSPAIAALVAAALMIGLRCLPISEARAALDMQLIITIGGALAIGKALDHSGAADSIAEMIVAAIGNNPYLLLIAIYLMAMIFTEMITNVAVAAMLLPIAIAVAAEGGSNPRPFIMAIAMAASLSFLTPIGYQTNLMVMGPGGYRSGDYLRVGFPLAVIIAITALTLIPILWPL